MTAYYNEIDPFAAQWLRNLIAAGHIAPGDVDERSIQDVTPADVAGYTQCHFFAGIGVWSYALRLAGWPDDEPVWSGSCPCQPFSAAGKGDGAADPRHLWPDWFKLIRECRPVVCFGEQVASRDGIAWLDLVHTDLEAAGYAVGALDLCAAGFGAPHIRQRIYFVAQSERRRQRSPQSEFMEDSRARTSIQPTDSGVDSLADPEIKRRRQRRYGNAHRPEVKPSGPCTDSGVAQGDADVLRHTRTELDGTRFAGDGPRESHEPTREPNPSFTNGFWSDAEWLACRDGKARATKPGIFPLAHGVAGRVGRLRAYGNAIVAPQAAEFIRAYRELMP